MAAIDTLCATLDIERTAARPVLAANSAAGLPTAPWGVGAGGAAGTHHAEIEATQREARRILRAASYVEPLRTRSLARLDAVVMHPVGGPLAAGGVAVCDFPGGVHLGAGADGLDQHGVSALGNAVTQAMPPGALQSLLVDGVIKGAGSVIVYLPQILILFFFILLLEDSGYLPRAAFLLDRLMGSVGLSGRSFIPLLSSYACAIPGSWPRARFPTCATASPRSCWRRS